MPLNDNTRVEKKGNTNFILYKRKIESMAWGGYYCVKKNNKILPLSRHSGRHPLRPALSELVPLLLLLLLLLL
jgi:hypothetical protein